MMFALARRHSISIIRLTFPLDDFKRFLLHRRFAIIVLVNAELLRCDLCNTLQTSHSPNTSPIGSMEILPSNYCWRTSLSSNDVEYAGHFIVLIGYEPNYDCFIYRDPAVRSYFCRIPATQFELARRSRGTDDDCIVVKL